MRGRRCYQRVALVEVETVSCQTPYREDHGKTSEILALEKSGLPAIRVICGIEIKFFTKASG